MISLLYPENYQKSGNAIYQNAVESLELDYIAMLICPYNTDFALNTLTELITDESVIKWRRDILEDFMNVPQLELKLYKSIHTIYEGALRSCFTTTSRHKDYDFIKYFCIRFNS